MGHRNAFMPIKQNFELKYLFFVGQRERNEDPNMGGIDPYPLVYSPTQANKRSEGFFHHGHGSNNKFMFLRKSGKISTPYRSLF